MRRLCALIKWVADRGVALAALLLLWPVLAAVAVLIRKSMGAPVLFRQVRPGYRENPICVLKFRTMREAVGADGRPLPDGERLTAVGRFVRQTSLDELPQLWNVLRGDMSLVGPRPLFMHYLDRYTPEQRRRHEVAPGMTGWAQVNGRNALSWEDRFVLDVWYVDNWSLRLDLRILLLTVARVLRREGINQPGQATVEEFQGADGPLASGA